MSRGFLVTFCLTAVAALLFWLFSIDYDFANPRVQVAAIAGTVVASGWLVTFAFREGSSLIDRNQHSRDFQLAFRAEVEDYSETLDDEDLESAIDGARKRLLDEKGDAIFFPLISAPIIFERLAKDVHIIPESVISYVIRFYSMLSDVTLFAQELRSPEFGKLSVQSKVDAFTDYIEMRATCCEFAYDALREIDYSLGEVTTESDKAAHALHQAERVKALKDWLNSRTLDRDALSLDEE